MKTTLLLWISLLFSGALSAQEWELIASKNRNEFFSARENVFPDFQFFGEYGEGFSFQLGIRDLKFDSLSYRLTLGFEQYSGSFLMREHHPGGGYSSEVEIEKSVISLGLYPLNIEFLQTFDVSLGLVLSALVDERVTGTRRTWNINSGTPETEIGEIYDEFSAKGYIGIQGRIANAFNVTDRLMISPQYSFYAGLSLEFPEFSDKVHTMRHGFSLALRVRIAGGGSRNAE